MLKTHFTLYTLILMLCLSGIDRLQAQDNQFGPPITEGIKILDLQEDENLAPLDGCMPTFKVTLKATGLDEYFPGQYGLPNGVPPLYIYFRMENYEEIIQVELFLPSTEFPFSPFPIYEFSFVFAPDIDNYCSFPNLGEVETRLVANQQGDPYPVTAQMMAGGIFTCQAFLETNCFCMGACSGPMFLQVEKLFDCSTCAFIITNDFTKPNDFDGQLSAGSTVNMEADVFPNPIRTELTIDYNLSNAANVDLVVYNISGQLMKRWTASGDKGFNRQQINAADWPKGIYLLYLQAGDQQQMLRLVKAE